MRASWTAACVTGLALICAGPATAAEYTPTAFDDSLAGTPAHCPPDVVENDPVQDCSLREALAAARNHEGDDVVKLSAGTYKPIASLSLDGDGRLTVRGAGARATTIDLDAGEQNPKRGLVIRGGTTAEITDLAITRAYTDGDFFLDGAALLVENDEEDGQATGIVRNLYIHDNQSEGNGGAISNQGRLSIESSLIEDNKAEKAGGAIENWGRLIISNSTLSGNQTLGSFDPEGSVGGAIDTQPRSENPSVNIDSSTITDNTAASRGGGIVAAGDVPTSVRNSIVSGNHVPDLDGEDYPNCLGTPVSGGHNLEDGDSCGFTAPGDVRADPKLGALANNGGPTDTRALLVGSPAINAGVTADCPIRDQRGFARTIGACDIGAFEGDAAQPGDGEQPPPPEGGSGGDKPPAQDGQPIPDGRTPDQPKCNDADKPFTTLKRSGVNLGAGGVTLSGRSADAKGACASGVERVQVSLAKVSGTELNCRFVSRSNRFVLTPFRNCRNPVMFRATGTSKWSFKFKAKLAPGKYRAQARGFDAARNKETPTKRRNIVFFNVK